MLKNLWPVWAGNKGQVLVKNKMVLLNVFKLKEGMMALALVLKIKTNQ